MVERVAPQSISPATTSSTLRGWRLGANVFLEVHAYKRGVGTFKEATIHVAIATKAGAMKLM